MTTAPPTPSGDADRPAEQAERDRFDQELKEDVPPRRAERLADADLARALGDRDEHDVHDADAADEQRHRRDSGEQRREHRGRLAQRVEDVGLIANAEIVLARLSGCDARGAARRVISSIASGISSSLDASAKMSSSAIGLEETIARRAERNEDLVVGATESGRRPWP